MTDQHAVDRGRRVLDLEARALDAAGRALDDRFARAVSLLVNADRVIVTGIGKSGLVARKIAATFTSTGTPASYLHPVDSLHGDLGIVAAGDVAIALSKSGETEELFGLVGILGRRGIPLIALTGAPGSTLATAAAVVLDAGVAEEACPLDLAPTTSTAVAMALGDALAMAVLDAKGFSRDDFGGLHPGGALGRKLFLRVRDVMVPVTATLARHDTMRVAVEHLAHYRGMALVAENGQLLGVVTAGDLSRLAEREHDYLGQPVDAVMTERPKTIRRAELAAAAVGVMERNGIMVLPVLDEEERLVGTVHLHDLMRAGAV